MERNDIFLSIRPKPKQANKSVIIKSIEGNVQRMFEGRKELLGLKTSGLEHITFLPSLSSITATAATNKGIRDQAFFKSDDIMSRGSGSNYGYHSSEEHDNQKVRDSYPLIKFTNYNEF